MKIRSAFPLVIAVITLLVIFFVVFNQIDSDSDELLFSSNDILPVATDNDNGFFLVWSLSEPEGVSMDDEQIMAKYVNMDFDYNEYKKRFRQYGPVLSATRLTQPYIRDFRNKIKKHRQKISRAEEKLNFIWQRYEMLLQADRVRDFTIKKEFYYVPDLHAFLNISKVYLASKALSCFKGDWMPFVLTVQRQMRLSRQLIRYSRTLETNWAGKELLRFILRVVVDMTASESPRWVKEQIFSFLPILDYDEYGSRNALVSEYLNFHHWLKTNKKHFRSGKGNLHVMLLFFQENRTLGYYNQFIRDVIEYEKRLPYTWENPIPEKPLLKNNKLWWLQNLSGKVLFDILSLPDFNKQVNDTYLTLTLYNLTRIALEYRISHDRYSSIEDCFKNLKSFKSVDPFSGKSFHWKDNQSLILYSVGNNRHDDHGLDTAQHPDMDIVLTVTKKPQ